MPDHVIHEIVVDLRLGEGEVTAICDEDVVGFLGLEHPIDNLLQMIHLLFGIVVLVSFLEINVIVIVLIKGEAFWPAVVAILLRHHDREDILLSTEVVLVWAPYLYLILLTLQLDLLFGINSCEEHGVEAHVFGEAGVAFGDAE